ncbi:hypothetical protein F2Q70_00023318 [Brassica cretica]|uniref:F-box domain-containing protein n=1 Tax=Brassica cretica TaxID=69181 RepID=A0A8S9GKL8_BRACR|nr:hypothetical protein F2Q70_00023318 [Brassica cretica]
MRKNATDGVGFVPGEFRVSTKSSCLSLSLSIDRSFSASSPSELLHMLGAAKDDKVLRVFLKSHSIHSYSSISSPLYSSPDRSLERTFLEMEGNNKKANTSSIDVISTLPDNVRSRILAFLTTKEAALALFLSKR